MPVLPNLPGVIRLNVHYTVGDNSHVVNRLWFHTTDPSTITAADLLNFCEVADTVWNATLKTFFGSDTTQTGCDATDMSSRTGATASSSVSVGGTAAGDSLPIQDTAVVDFRINDRYRGGHPRNSLSGMTTDAMADASHWTTGFQSGLSGAYGTFVGESISGAPPAWTSLAHVVPRIYSGHTWVQDEPSGNWKRILDLAGSIAVDVVQAYTTRALIGAMRRRTV
jgi:hypothetical protein